jgi:hypothetical protein
VKTLLCKPVRFHYYGALYCEEHCPSVTQAVCVLLRCAALEHMLATCSRHDIGPVGLVSNTVSTTLAGPLNALSLLSFQHLAVTCPSLTTVWAQILLPTPVCDGGFASGVHAVMACCRITCSTSCARRALRMPGHLLTSVCQVVCVRFVWPGDLCGMPLVTQVICVTSFGLGCAGVWIDNPAVTSNTDGVCGLVATCAGPSHMPACSLQQECHRPWGSTGCLYDLRRLRRLVA